MNHTVRIKDIVAGARIVTGHRSYWSPTRPNSHPDADELACVVIEQDGEGLFFLNPAGVAQRFVPNPDKWSDVKMRLPHGVLWTIPIPAATDEQLKRLAMATVGLNGIASGSDRPWLLHVHAVEQGVAYATPLVPKEDVRGPGTITVDERYPADRKVGSVSVWNRTVRIEAADDLCRAGTLCIMWPDKARMAGGMPLHRAKAFMTVAELEDVAAVGAWLPETLGHESYYTSIFADVSDIDEEELRAELREEPNEALVLGYLDGDTRTGTLLGKSGITFHHSDDTMVDLLGMDDAELGLWLATDAKWTGSGEDCEIQADWRPATIEDVERFGYTHEGFLNEIAGDLDVRQGEITADLLAQTIAQAEEVCAKDAWATEIRRTWFAIAQDLSALRRHPNPDWKTFLGMSILEDLAREAGNRSIQPDGWSIEHDEESMRLVWPEGSIEARSDRTITLGVQDQPYETFVTDTSDTRASGIERTLEWLASRPANIERTIPNDPRTVHVLRPSED